MRQADLREPIVSPISGKPLLLEVFSSEGEHVMEGLLAVPDRSEWYPIIAGVPSFLLGPLRPDLRAFCARYGLDLPIDDAPAFATGEQAKTNLTFSDKWRRFKNYGLEPSHEEFLFGWYMKKFGLPDRQALVNFYSGRDKVLEVGPGSGFNTRFMAQHCKGHVFALDVSDAAFTTFENTRHLSNCTVVQADLMASPFVDDSFDLIIADGVLHHTPNTRAAVETLYKKVKPGGQFFFYIYRKMGAARQFCDAFIREQFTKLTPEECYAACESLTEMGRALGQLNAKIVLEKSVDVLGIPAGEHDVQRLLYYNFVKCFWNDAFDFETNNMVNFDWYHPHNAWQNTDDEVRGWLTDLGAETWKFNDSNPNGISVVVDKPSG